jgi:hypothetical protein
MLGDVPDSRFAVPAALAFAFQAPLLNHWPAMVEMSPSGLVFSRMPNDRQNGVTVKHAKPLAVSSFQSGHLRALSIAPGLPATEEKKEEAESWKRWVHQQK